MVSPVHLLVVEKTVIGKGVASPAKFARMINGVTGSVRPRRVVRVMHASGADGRMVSMNGNGLHQPMTENAIK